MIKENSLEIIASADDYWTVGVEKIEEGYCYGKITSEYSRLIAIEFMANSSFRLEHLRAVLRAARDLDGEASRRGQFEHMSKEEQVEFNARRLAHHVLKYTERFVSADDRLADHVGRSGDEELNAAYGTLQTRRTEDVNIRAKGRK